MLAIVVALYNAACKGGETCLGAHQVIVTSTADTGDDSLDGTCDQCTLREAIQEANANNNPNDTDIIQFNISGTGPHTITPSFGFEITQAVVIDGYTQPGSSENTFLNTTKGTNATIMIDLDGSSTSNDRGLEITAPNVEVRGLAIHSFDSTAVFVASTASASRIAGNFIGTDPAGGDGDVGNNGDGVAVEATGVFVGGADPEERQIISGTSSLGVRIAAQGTAAVQGNLIGTEKDGKSPLGNLSTGVNIDGASINSIGGGSAGAANVIAYNGDGGVVVFGDEAQNNLIRRNSIFKNTGQGIDIGFSGQEVPDNCDEDTGANGLQNFPVIRSAVTSAGTTTIKASLNSAAGQQFEVNFYGNPGGSDIEGKKFLTSKVVTTRDDCTRRFSVTTTKSPGKFITATATRIGSDGTSEFSVPTEVVSQ